MGKKIVWSKLALKSFGEVISYLEQNWSEKEVEEFKSVTRKALVNISEFPGMFIKVSPPNIHQALITKHNILIYRNLINEVELMFFWDTRQDPMKKRF